MHRSRKFSILVATLAMAGVFTVACDSGTQEPSAPDDSMSDTSGEVADSAGEAAPPPGLAEGSTATIPEEFPNEVPIYPGALASQGKGAVSDGSPMAAVQLQTTDTPKEVYDFYVEQLSKDGWTIQEQKGLEGKNAVSATNGKCTATMMAAPSEDGGSQIFLITEC
jgi:hypothetical protein